LLDSLLQEKDAHFVVISDLVAWKET